MRLIRRSSGRFASKRELAFLAPMHPPVAPARRPELVLNVPAAGREPRGV